MKYFDIIFHIFLKSIVVYIFLVSEEPKSGLLTLLIILFAEFNEIRETNREIKVLIDKSNN